MSGHKNRRFVYLWFVVLALAIPVLLLASEPLASQAGAAGDLELSLELVAEGFVAPTDIAFDPMEGAAFVVEKEGRIYQIENGAPAATTFLSITNRVGSLDAEQGLLGLVFHPNYANNRFLYVNYTDQDGDTQIARFTANGDNTWADPNSEFTILSVEQPYINNNGGDLLFGPDGYLYIPLGDGGWVNDPESRAQDPQTLLGKILRVDVDGGSPYAVPTDNPFVGDPSTLDEIWALGVRNPWRASFDRATGEFYVANVGEWAWEEVEVQPAGVGGQNYAWSCFEGSHENPNTSVPDCGPAQDYTMPVFEYDHTEGECAITGGFVYRGTQYPNMVGRYFMTDYCAGFFWELHPDGQGGWSTARYDNVPDSGSGLVTFGEDGAGELYLANLFSGKIYQLTESLSSALYLPLLLNDTIP